MYGCTLVRPPALPDRSSSLQGTRDISLRPTLVADVAVNRIAADPSRRPYHNAPVMGVALELSPKGSPEDPTARPGPSGQPPHHPPAPDSVKGGRVTEIPDLFGCVAQRRMSSGHRLGCHGAATPEQNTLRGILVNGSFLVRSKEGTQLRVMVSAARKYGVFLLPVCWWLGRSRPAFSCDFANPGSPSPAHLAASVRLGSGQY